jgi:hypothetical protein
MLLEVDHPEIKFISSDDIRLIQRSAVRHLGHAEETDVLVAVTKDEKHLILRDAPQKVVEKLSADH